MSLFGTPSGASPFGSTPATQQKPLFGGFGTPAPAQASSSPFGTTPAATSSGPSLFGSTQGTQQKPLFGGFGTPQTSAPPQSSPFGSTPAATSQPSLFGSAPAATAQPASSSFLGTVMNNNSQPQQPSSFFGTATAAASGIGQSQASPFGSTPASSAPQGNSLFNRITLPTTSSQPSLFGSTTTTSQPQTTAAPAASSLFGGFGLNQNQSQSQAQPTSSLFSGLGSNQNQNQQQQQPTSSLFGGLNNANNTQSNSGLGFLNSSQNPQQGASSLFGSSMRPGGLTMGQSTSQPQQTVPGVKIDVSNIRGTTRFNDLHEELQKSIEQIDAFIQQQIAFKDQCEALMPSHEQNLTTIPNDVEYVTNQLETTELAVQGDIASVTAVKDMVQKDADNARLGFQAVENLKLPQQFHYSGMWQRGTPPRVAVSDDSSSDSKASDLLSFFNSTAGSLSSTLEAYEKSLAEIESYLGSVEQQTLTQDRQNAFRRGLDGRGRTRDDQIRELQMLLSNFQDGILRTAERVGSVREQTSDLVEGNTAVSNGRR